MPIPTGTLAPETFGLSPHNHTHVCIALSSFLKAFSGLAVFCEGQKGGKPCLQFLLIPQKALLGTLL